MSDLIDFYGTECGICKQMEPLVARLEEELGVEVEKKEVWHDAENARLLQELDNGQCGGVPFFYNMKTKQWICGKADYEKLKAWALGK